MGQKRQGGSTIGYVLIGVALIAGFVGGVYALRQVTAQKPAEAVVRQDEAKEQKQQPEKQEQGQDVQSTEGAPTSDAPATSHPETSRQDEVTTQPQKEEKAPEKEYAELPRTGASDTGNWAIFGLLTAVGVAYVRSRRFTLT